MQETNLLSLDPCAVNITLHLYKSVRQVAQIDMSSTHPKREPKKPLEEVSFFSASAINCIAFCSLSAIVRHLNFHRNKKHF